MNNHYAVIGNPVLHSLSPLIHQRAFDYYKMNARYFAYEVQDFSLFMEYFRTGQNKEKFQPYSYLGQEKSLVLQEKKLVEYREQDYSFPMQGLSITIPYKKDVLQIADSMSYKAKLSGAANTLYWKDNQLIAENTDIHGFYAPIQEKIIQGKKYQSALIYGAGGAARAVLVGLLHCSDIEQIYICARREEQAQELIVHIKKQQELLEQYTLNTQAKLTYIPLEHTEFSCDIVVNTIPQWAENAQSPRKDFSNVQIAYDLTYKQTPFLLKAQDENVMILDGKKMFIEQAKAQFYLWTHKEIPISCYADLF